MGSAKQSSKNVVVALRLVHDPHPNLVYSRRRADCTYLSPCEVAWISVYRWAQAKCPSECPHYKAKATRAADDEFATADSMIIYN